MRFMPKKAVHIDEGERVGGSNIDISRSSCTELSDSPQMLPKLSFSNNTYIPPAGIFIGPTSGCWGFWYPSLLTPWKALLKTLCYVQDEGENDAIGFSLAQRKY